MLDAVVLSMLKKRHRKIQVQNRGNSYVLVIAMYVTLELSINLEIEVSEIMGKKKINVPNAH